MILISAFSAIADAGVLPHHLVTVKLVQFLAVTIILSSPIISKYQADSLLANAVSTTIVVALAPAAAVTFP
jgi:hypothetical protein